MERFAINILHKRIYKICRLCGVDNPIKVPIIEEGETIIVGDGEDEEATLAKKIEECVGIQVHKDDKMPQNICSLCVDKINDFYEYRLMCAATNLQTRTILNLNLVEPTRKLLNFEGLPVKQEDKKEDVKKVVEVATSSSTTTIPATTGKKGKKRRGPPSPSPSPAPTTRVKAPVDIVKDEPVPVTPVKALTKKERLKQLQQQKEDEKKKKEEEISKKDKKEDKIKKEEKGKKEEAESSTPKTKSKRKEAPEAAAPAEAGGKVEPAVPPPKKIKFEHPCSYCSDEFKTQTELDSHLTMKHCPVIRKFGCGSCRETFETVLESKDHNLWHQLTRTLYTCFKCKKKYDKNIALVKHMALNACGRVARGRPPTIHPDTQCRLCNKKFKTQNLYEWHSCFIKPKAKCPKCGKFFVKKQILLRHYIMYCTGTLPPPEPIIVPKEEPIDPSEKPAAGSAAGGSTVADRRTRRTAIPEPELPKEEREIPFPPPLELAPEAKPTPAPSGSKKKGARKEQVDENSAKLATTALEAEKIASLLNSGAKLDRDTDIATINNLLSSVTEAIASISEAKAKKKKKKKEKNKDKEGTKAVEAPPAPPPPEPQAVPEPEPEPVPPAPVVDERTEEEKQAYALAQEVSELTLDQQLALCSDKLPMVVLLKTTFKQETTEIDTEPSQLQEPMDEDDQEQTTAGMENGAGDDNYDDAGANDYSGFQDDDDNDDQQPEEEQQPPAAAEEEEQEQEEETEPAFPMPIKQEPDPEEPAQEEQQQAPAAAEPVVEAAPQPVVEPTKEPEKQSLFDEQLAVNIKKEPGLEEEEEENQEQPQPEQPPAAKRKRPGSRASATSGTPSSLSSDAAKSSEAAGSPKPALILKIKKEKGLLNSRTIVLDSDTDEDVPPQPTVPEPPVVAAAKKKVYKKPNILAVKIKQEKVDPGYEKQEQVASNMCELPGGIRIKQERLDPDEELPPLATEDEPQEDEDESPPQKKVCSSPIVAFDGVRIKQEKPDDSPRPARVESAYNKPATPPPAPAAAPAEKKSKKSKVKINPFALLRQKMAAEAAAKQASAPPPTQSTSEQPQQPQAPSPLPVITNVVGSSCEPERSAVPVIAQVTSIAEEERVKPVEKVPQQFSVAIKQEPVDEEEEEVGEEQQQEEEEEEQLKEQEEEQQEEHVDHGLPMPIKEEAPDDVPSESPAEEEEEEEEDSKDEEEEGTKGDEEELASKDEDEGGAMDDEEEQSKGEPDEKSKESEDESNEEEDETPVESSDERTEQAEATKEPMPTENEKLDESQQPETTNGSANDEHEQTENDDEEDAEEENSSQEAEKTEHQAVEEEKQSDENESEDKQKDEESDHEDEEEVEQEQQPEENAENKSEQNQESEQETNDEEKPRPEEDEVDEQLNADMENSTSPISDVPMDDYDDQDSQKEQPAVNSTPSVEETQKEEQNSQQTAVDSVQVITTDNQIMPQNSSQSETTDPSRIDRSEPVESSANTNSRLESDLEELQNLLTKGLEPPLDGDTIQQASSSGSTDQDVGPTSATTTCLEDDLDSLLNNKLEEISDQLNPTAAAASSHAVEDMKLAIERELLHDIMPAAVEQQQQSSLPLEIGHDDRLPDGTGTGQM